MPGSRFESLVNTEAAVPFESLLQTIAAGIVPVHNNPGPG